MARFLFDKSSKPEFELLGKTVDDDVLETAYFLEELGSGSLRSNLEDMKSIRAYIPEVADALNVLSNGFNTEEKLCSQIGELLMERHYPLIPMKLRALRIFNKPKADEIKLLIDEVKLFNEAS